MVNLYNRVKRLKCSLFLHNEAFIPYFIYSFDDKVSNPNVLRLKKMPKNQSDYNDEIYQALAKYDDKDSIFRCLDFNMKHFSNEFDFVKFIEEETYRRINIVAKRRKWQYLKFLELFILPYTEMYGYCIEWVNAIKKKAGYNKIRLPVKCIDPQFSKFKVLQMLYWFLNIKHENGSKVFDANIETVSKLAMNFEPFDKKAFHTISGDNILSIFPGEKQKANGIKMIDYYKEFEVMMEPVRKYLLDPTNIKTKINQKKKR